MLATEATENRLTTDNPTRHAMTNSMDWLKHPDRFVNRHIGPDAGDIDKMLAVLGHASLDGLVDAAVPANIRLARPLNLPAGRSEFGVLNELRAIAAQNQIFHSYIGLGYHDCITPPVIQRNILENPGWYTQYTPYQAEISQGRLEMLLNFQTMMCHRLQHEEGRDVFFVSQDCHPQIIEVVQTRAKALDLGIVMGNHHSFNF